MTTVVFFIQQRLHSLRERKQDYAQSYEPDLFGYGKGFMESVSYLISYNARKTVLDRRSNQTDRVTASLHANTRRTLTFDL